MAGGFFKAQVVKNLPIMQETKVWSLYQEDPLEKKTATHCSVLPWRIPWTEEPGRLQSMGSHLVRHDWVTNTFFHFLNQLLGFPFMSQRDESSFCRWENLVSFGKWLIQNNRGSEWKSLFKSLFSTIWNSILLKCYNSINFINNTMPLHMAFHVWYYNVNFSQHWKMISVSKKLSVFIRPPDVLRCLLLLLSHFSCVWLCATP